MKLLSEIFNFVYQYHHMDKKSHYIIFKIVDFIPQRKIFILQCINTNAIFQSTIMEIVSDPHILHGLHPIQACYIGMEYTKLLKNEVFNSEEKENRKIKQSEYCVFRYGRYLLSYQDRKGNLCFKDIKTSETFFMDPRDISLSEIIQEFDAAQAFYIGLFAGFKLKKSPMHGRSEIYNQNYIRLVK